MARQGWFLKSDDEVFHTVEYPVLLNLTARGWEQISEEEYDSLIESKWRNKAKASNKYSLLDGRTRHMLDIHARHVVEGVYGHPVTDLFIHETATTMSVGYRDVMKSGKTASWVNKLFTMKAGVDEEKRAKFLRIFEQAVEYYNGRLAFHRGFAVPA